MGGLLGSGGGFVAVVFAARRVIGGVSVLSERVLSGSFPELLVVLDLGQFFVAQLFVPVVAAGKDRGPSVTAGWIQGPQSLSNGRSQ